MSRSGTAIELRAHDLVRCRVPDLRIGGSKTSSDSTHDLEYLGTLVRWNDFEQEMRQGFDSVQWGMQSDVLPYSPLRNSTGNSTFHEQLLCGDEHSTVARFGQNLGHVMTSVFQTLALDAQFGNFKTCSDAKVKGPKGTMKIPDIVVVNNSGKLKIIGEAKTPWVHDIQAQVNQANQRPFRNYVDTVSFNPLKSSLV